MLCHGTTYKYILRSTHPDAPVQVTLFPTASNYKVMYTIRVNRETQLRYERGRGYTVSDTVRVRDPWPVPVLYEFSGHFHSEQSSWWTCNSATSREMLRRARSSGELNPLGASGGGPGVGPTSQDHSSSGANATLSSALFHQCWLNPPRSALDPCSIVFLDLT